jgi:hypothetical protein
MMVLKTRTNGVRVPYSFDGHSQKSWKNGRRSDSHLYSAKDVKLAFIARKLYRNGKNDVLIDQTKIGRITNIVTVIKVKEGSIWLIVMCILRGGLLLMGRVSRAFGLTYG